jgi:hypothetical protein
VVISVYYFCFGIKIWQPCWDSILVKLRCFFATWFSWRSATWNDTSHRGGQSWKNSTGKFHFIRIHTCMLPILLRNTYMYYILTYITCNTYISHTLYRTTFYCQSPKCQILIWRHQNVSINTLRTLNNLT